MRVFSDDATDSIVGSVGVDYLLNSQSWRGTLGAAYLGGNAYIGLDMGLGFGGGGVDFGMSVGVTNTISLTCNDCDNCDDFGAC